jgi:hypothetical protein
VHRIIHGGAVDSVIEPPPNNPTLASMDPAIRAHQDDVLRLMTQVTEMGSHLEEALRAYHQLEDTLVAAQMALGALGRKSTWLVLPPMKRRLIVLVSYPSTSYFSICSFEGLFLIPSIFQTRRRGCWSFAERWGTFDVGSSTWRRTLTSL